MRPKEQYTEAEKAAAEVAAEHGLEITIVQGGSIKTVEQENGKDVLTKSRALIDGTRMVVRSDDPLFTPAQIARHEAAHWQIQNGQINLGKLIRQIQKKYSTAQIREMIHLYTVAYGNHGLTGRWVLEEMVCDAMGEMNAFATEETSSVAGEVGQFLRDLRKAALETQTDGQKNNAPEGVKFSREMFDNAARQFDNEISQWDNDGRDGNRQFILGTTGEILQGLGAVENDIYMNGDKINTILEEHPEMTLSEIKQIPQILNDPTLILKSRNVGRRGSQNTRMVLFGTAKAQNNLPIMVIFDVRPTEGHFVVTDMQKVTSAYTKTTDAVGFVKNSFVMYADKKRATPLLRTIGFHTPIELRQGGYVGSIAYNKQNVNLYGEEFSNVFREGTTKYSRELTTDGRVVAVVDEDILSNLDLNNWNQETKKAAKKAAAQALLDFKDGIEVEGITRKVNKTSRDEYTRSRDSARLARNNPSAFADKMRAASVADDIIIAATQWKRDGKLMHQRADNFSDFDHGTVLIESKGRQYSAEVVVGITNEGEAVFYDVVDLSPTTFEIEKVESHSAASANEPLSAITGDSTSSTVAQQEQNVKQKYSRELETVEALKRQNELLQEQRDYWKEQTRTTDEKTRGADKGEVRSLANQLIRQYSSKTEVDEILPEMQWLADSIWKNDPKISYTDLQDSAQNIARMVLDGSEVNLNADNWETGQELKRFLRGRYINVDESLKEDIGDFKAFKQSNRSLHFRENGAGWAWAKFRTRGCA